jgi:alpha/beta superfamily hydrolase
VSVEAERLALETIDGVVLDAEAAIPPGPWAAAVVCHPHPLYGGDLHNNVVDALVRALSGAGVAAVRFDFRGVGRSGGEHGDGETERLDVVAAIDAAAPLAGDGPVLLAGYSFGAAVALSVADPRLDGWFLVAPPLAMPRRTAWGEVQPTCRRIRTPEARPVHPPAAMQEAVAEWAATTVEVVPMADHFMAGATVRGRAGDSVRQARPRGRVRRAPTPTPAGVSAGAR